jgi:hypothetical protein
VLILDESREAVSGEREVLLHAHEELAGRTVDPRAVEDVQPAVAVEISGSTVLELLPREARLGEDHPSSGDARPDDAVLFVRALNDRLEVALDRFLLADERAISEEVGVVGLPERRLKGR